MELNKYILVLAKMLMVKHAALYKAEMELLNKKRQEDLAQNMETLSNIELYLLFYLDNNKTSSFGNLGPFFT